VRKIEQAKRKQQRNFNLRYSFGFHHAHKKQNASRVFLFHAVYSRAFPSRLSFPKKKKHAKQPRHFLDNDVPSFSFQQQQHEDNANANGELSGSDTHGTTKHDSSGGSSVPLEHVSTLFAATSSTCTPKQFFQKHEDIENMLRPLLKRDSDHLKNNIHGIDGNDIDVDESFWKSPLSVIAMEDFGDNDDDDLKAFSQQINGVGVLPTLIPTVGNATALVAPQGDYWSFKRCAINCAISDSHHE
jgi:hypothetical protein